VNEHVFSEVTDYDGRLVKPKAVIDTSVTSRSVRVVLHQPFGDIFPIASLRNVLISLQYEVGVTSDKMIAATFKMSALPLSVVRRPSATVLAPALSMPVLKARQIADGVIHGELLDNRRRKCECATVT